MYGHMYLASWPSGPIQAAYPDDVLGERACAVVVPRPGQTVTLA